MTFGVVNPVDEGIFVTVILFLVVGFYGPEFY